MFCSSCGQQLSSGARFCAKCGKPVTVDSGETVMGDETSLDANQETLAPGTSVPPPRTPIRIATTPRIVRSPSASNPLLTSDPIGGGRFAPGLIIGDRYRIVAILGRGGMGEVYRAEDLKLSQVVAIKFLPEALSKDVAALARFHSEVRVARQVSHPNVCRVFDIGDAEGIPFLTMEYVDGEDLSSLIRRIGRLPQDKAIEIFRQICAGLSAAHERGVVHRDLKPANLMLDGAGKIRVTDFGLAAVAATIQGAEVRAGTPAYMAPEQLAGKEVTIKSDLYSLGLVMYEVLTGKRAFDAATLPDLLKARSEASISNPSALVRDLDPLLERVILRCLENDPTKRPASALQVAAALPGGDPLAAALAAGETPSPEMVAAAGEKEGVQPKLAVACLAGIIALICISMILAIRESGLKRIYPEYSGEILAHKAREIITSLGYPARPQDAASGFDYAEDHLDYLSDQIKKGANTLGWDTLLTQRAPLLFFWFRQSPEEFKPTGFQSIALTPGIVTFDDPAQTFSGMINLRLDPQARLLYFQAIPAEKEEPTLSSQEMNWQPLFSAAGLNLADFRSAATTWTSLASSDTRAAWDGTWPGTSEPLHVEAAAWRGKPVFFRLVSAWTVPSRMPAQQSSGSQRASQIFGTTFVILLVAGGLWLAYRNYSRGRGDRRGALRLASVVFVLELVLFLAAAHLSFSGQSLDLLMLAASTGLYMSAFTWVLYIALEPYVRSKWPQTIVSWTRLLAGNLRDPLVGRDLLFGIALGLVWVFVYFLGYFFDIRMGERPLLPQADFLEGARAVLSVWLGNVVAAIVAVVMFFFLLVLLRVLVRNRWLAAALFVLLFATPKMLVSHHPLIDGPVWLAIYGISAFAVVRFGLIVLASAVFTANVLLNLPYTLDFSAWYATGTICVVLSFVALALWGFYTALAGQRLLKQEFFD
jgi:serine/threonine-protein kinase